MSGFTRKQSEVIADVLAEANELYGGEVKWLPLPDHDAVKLELPRGTTYEQAHAEIDSSGSRRQARDFVRVVLALRHDPRVQGEELS
jgi:hypothetical protein